MVWVRAKMTTGEGVIECTGAPTPVPGLAVAVTRNGPVVVHVRSGMAVGAGYGDAEAALAAASWGRCGTGPAPAPN